jgi:C4-dicarboxylate-specific signal transduction histidine kinase
MEIGWMRARMRPEDYVEMIAHVQQAVETGSSTVEFRFRHRDGSLRMIQSRMCSFTDADGNTEVLSIWIDMTRERTLANQLDQAAKLADLGALAAGLAHELNNPLAAIMLTAENAINVIENLPDPPTRVASKLATICELATRAAQLIRHVQLFSRFDNGQYMPVALEALLADMMVLARAKLMQSNVSVLIDTPADLPPVLARPVALEQVLINLVTNACDAYRLAIPKISSIHRKVWIESRQVDGWVVLDVRDQAGGVPEQYLPHLFSSFFTTKPAGEGTGLGLSISARIATEMGGTLSVINQNGGATFTLRLPMLAD